MEPDVQPIPVATLQYASPSSYAGEAVWREGNKIVCTMSRERTIHLPDRCVKCNAPTDDRKPWKKTLYWHNPGFFALILLNLLIYALVALAVRKKVIVTAGLCAAHRAKRRNNILIAWGIFLLALLVFAGAVFFGNDPNYRHGPLGPICVLLGIVLLLAAVIWGMVGGRVVVVRKIADHTVWFGGAGREFLASLPGQ